MAKPQSKPKAIGSLIYKKQINVLYPQSKTLEIIKPERLHSVVSDRPWILSDIRPEPLIPREDSPGEEVA